MTKEEAIKAMSECKKVRHRYFSPDEWMTMKEGMMILGDGVIIPHVTCTPEEFWKWRTDSRWDDGYEIF